MTFFIIIYLFVYYTIESFTGKRYSVARRADKSDRGTCSHWGFRRAALFPASRRLARWEALAISRLNLARVLLDLEIKSFLLLLKRLVITCLSKDHADYWRLL